MLKQHQLQRYPAASNLARLCSLAQRRHPHIAGANMRQLYLLLILLSAKHVGKPAECALTWKLPEPVPTQT